VTYRIEFTEKAVAQLAVLPKDAQSKLAAQIAALAGNPHPPSSRKIKGHQDCYRIRQGDYRVVYAVIDSNLLVIVARAGHRKEVYERLQSVDRAVQRFRKEPN